MGDPIAPTEAERREALALAERILDDIRNDEPVRPLTTAGQWLLASTLKHHAETIAEFQEAHRV